MEDFIDFFKMVMAPMIVIIVFSVLIIAIPLFFIGRAECNRYETETGRHTKFFILGGCYVSDTSGRSIPYDEFKARAITNEAAQP